MEDLQLIINALDAANKKGVFSLQDSGSILSAINSVGDKLKRLQSPVKTSKESNQNEKELILDKPSEEG